MKYQRQEQLNMIESPTNEFRYIAHMKARETFANTIRKLGIYIPDTGSHVSFVTRIRLNMRAYKERGLIFSYSIIKVRTTEEVLEEG